MISLRIGKLYRFLWQCHGGNKSKVDNSYGKAWTTALKFGEDSAICRGIQKELIGWIDESEEKGTSSTPEAATTSSPTQPSPRSKVKRSALEEKILKALEDSDSTTEEVPPPYSSSVPPPQYPYM